MLNVRYLETNEDLVIDKLHDTCEYDEYFFKLYSLSSCNEFKWYDINIAKKCFHLAILSTYTSSNNLRLQSRILSK